MSSIVSTMNECSALIRDSYIERQLLEETDDDISWKENQIIGENLQKSWLDVCSWIPNGAGQFRRHSNDNKSSNQSKPHSKLGANLRTTTQAHAKRIQGANFRKGGQCIEFHFKHYNNPKKYIEQYRRFHTFGGPLERLSSREITTRERNREVNNTSRDFTEEQAGYLHFGQPFTPLKSCLQNGGMKRNSPDIELQLQLISRRPATTIQGHSLVNDRSDLKYHASFSGNTSLPSYCALTETAKSRRRTGNKGVSRVRGYESTGSSTQRHSADALLYASNISYRAPPHTAPTDTFRKSLEVHLPHGEKMVLKNNKLYSWEQSSFTDAIDSNYQQSMMGHSAIPRAPYMPGSLIKHLPPTFFAANQNHKSTDVLIDKPYRDNAINCSTGVTVDYMDSDGSYTPMVEERRPQHTEIMLENFYKELLAAAHQLQRAQPGKQVLEKDRIPRPTSQTNSVASSWEPRLAESVLRIFKGDNTAKGSNVKGQPKSVSISQIIDHCMPIKTEDERTARLKHGRVYMDYPTGSEGQRSRVQRSPRQTHNYSGCSPVTEKEASPIAKIEHSNSKKVATTTILKLCSKHKEYVNKGERFSPKPANILSENMSLSKNNNITTSFTSKRQQECNSDGTDSTTKSKLGKEIAHHRRASKQQKNDFHKYVSSHSQAMFANSAPSLNSHGMQTYVKPSIKRNVSTEAGSKDQNEYSYNTVYHVRLGNPCDKSS
ncbi:uncharacterized protein [Apostichopus japonicus]|uniref:uncharacterized protein isoform X1 n=1 Tax=Stichopus japonicus TaxID=307972 RepID=UPI003AB8713D